jgi:SAM-dependent methyltransferase
MTAESQPPSEDTRGILFDVARYYGAKLAEHGPTARGVDWKDATSQHTRFDVLLTLVEDPAASLLDYGCGYGALLQHARRKGFRGNYLGTDIEPKMIEAAQVLHQADANACFCVGDAPAKHYDYVIASGIFNVRLHYDLARWNSYMEETISRINRVAIRGFAFNCLTSYSHANWMRPDLHYADPLAWFNVCKTRYASAVALLHDYGLWEWTLIVRKDR